MLFVLHAEKKKINTRMRGKKSYLARGWRWLAAFLAVLWRRPVAVSWLTDGGSKRRCCDLLPLLLCVFLLLYSPLFLFYSFASHSVVIDWEASDSW